MNQSQEIVDILQDLLRSRKEKNRHYSMRAFARDLEISPSYLCEVLKNKHSLSRDKEMRIRKMLATLSSGLPTQVFRYKIELDDLSEAKDFLDELANKAKNRLLPKTSTQVTLEISGVDLEVSAEIQ